MTSLTKLTPQWHTEAATLLQQNFEQIHSNFLDSTKKAVWLGMFLNHIKEKGKADGSIPHGQFGPWLEVNLPTISRQTVKVYMRLATNVCEKGKFQIDDFRHFAELGKLPPTVLQIIEGKTQHQLLLEFRNPEHHNKHHPRKQHTPEEIVQSEIEQAQAVLEMYVTHARILFDNISSKDSNLVSRITKPEWREASQITTELSKALRDLAHGRNS